MEWCQPHWSQLKQKVVDKGMWSLVSSNGGEAADIAVAQLEGDDTKFDPLLNCCFGIFNFVMSHVGLRAMGQCPLCILVQDGQPELVENYLDGCTNDALQHCMSHNLLTRQ